MCHTNGRRAALYQSTQTCSAWHNLHPSKTKTRKFVLACRSQFHENLPIRGLKKWGDSQFKFWLYPLPCPMPATVQIFFLTPFEKWYKKKCGPSGGWALDTPGDWGLGQGGGEVCFTLVFRKISFCFASCN